MNNRGRNGSWVEYTLRKLHLPRRTVTEDFGSKYVARRPPATVLPIGRAVRISVALGAARMPNILLTADRHPRHRTRESRLLLAAGIVERHAHGVRIGPVLIDKHQRPVSVGTLDSIRRDHHVAVLILDAGLGRVHLMPAGP